MEKEIEAPIFDIQRFSLHDGPGIRTLVFFKGCFLSCEWCQNPESQEARPLIAFYRNRCQENFDCKEVCPENAILSRDFRIDYEKCTACEKCVAACAYGALKLIGRMMTPEKLLSQILPDLHYYQKSGGGVTFSGGEPTLYPEFLEQMLNLCQQKKIHTALETCGSFSFKRWKAILRKLDLIYFDLKIINSLRHKQAAGLPNSTILKNAKRLAKENFPVQFRTPLIKDQTDTEENLQKIVLHLRAMKQTKIHLLKYHNMGETKIDVIQGKQKKMGLPAYSEQRFKQVKEYFNREGIEVHNPLLEENK